MKVVSQLDDEGYFAFAASADPDHLVPGGYLTVGRCIDLLPPANLESGMRYKPVAGEWVGEPIPDPIPDPIEAPVLTPEELATAEAASQRAATLAAISALEAQQARPVREIIAALAIGGTLPALAVEKITAIETQISDLRKQL